DNLCCGDDDMGAFHTGRRSCGKADAHETDCSGAGGFHGKGRILVQRKDGQKASRRNGRRCFRIHASEGRDGGLSCDGSYMEHIFDCAVKEKRQMIFIFGGAYQGMLTYALENLGVKTVSDCTDGSCPDFTKDAVYGIEGFVLEAVR